MVNRVMRLLYDAKVLFTTSAAVAVTVVCCLMIWTFWLNQPALPDDPTRIREAEIPGLCGWAGEEIARDEFARLKGQFTPFVIWDAAAKAQAVSQDKRSALWDASTKILGHHLPTFRQETGDCVSMGAANAVMYLACVQILAGEPIEFRDVFPPYIYGTSRVFVGKARIPCRSAGSLGSWAALAVKDYGILFADAEGVPSYSGSLADKWGCKPGPPEPLIAIAKKFPVKSVANVTTWQEVRDALINGYPVTIASSVGFAMNGVVRDGKLWLTQRGTWQHQMCVIGYDPKPEPCFCILNSWGANAHGKQPDGPDGSFWVKATVVQKIVSQGDSHAFSSFSGFPRQEWNLDILKQKGAHHDDRDLDRTAFRSAGRCVEPEFALSG